MRIRSKETETTATSSRCLPTTSDKKWKTKISSRVRDSFIAQRHNLEEQQHGDESNLHTSVCTSDSFSGDRVQVDKASSQASATDSMDVQIHLRSLSGLLLRRQMDNCSKRRSAQRRKPILSASSFRIVVGSETNHCSEGAAVRTFLPSHEVKLFGAPAKHLKEVPFTAFWDDGIHQPRSNCENLRSLSTLRINTKMKRVTYKKNFHVGQVPHFQPQHIHLTIGVGYGTEMITLGEACIAISGEEENNTPMYVPVRGVSATSSQHFSSDSGLSFSLDANASLFVSVQVLPRNLNSFESIPTPLVANHPKDKVEFADENSLISSFYPDETTRHSSWARFWFALSGCGEIPLCTMSGFDTADGPKNAEKLEFTQAGVTPLYMLSDVSESTFGVSSDEFDDFE